MTSMTNNEHNVINENDSNRKKLNMGDKTTVLDDIIETSVVKGICKIHDDGVEKGKIGNCDTDDHGSQDVNCAICEIVEKGVLSEICAKYLI